MWIDYTSVNANLWINLKKEPLFDFSSTLALNRLIGLKTIINRNEMDFIYKCKRHWYPLSYLWWICWYHR
jgi:hypothetical protein